MTVVPGSEVEYADLPGRRSADPFHAVAAASSLRVVRLVRGEHRLAHRHPASEEVMYVHEGTGAVYIDGTFTALGPGDVVHVPAGAAHATVPDPGVLMVLICFFPHPELAENLEETDIDVMTVATDE
jgi:quercetin dioxygenase-like cupin family protein